tara:strand:+ start:1087 stop:1641 length:555 start_codon:yes stop_codon:yes gene_type:complete
MKQFTPIFTIVIITIMMMSNLHSLLEVEDQQEQLHTNELLIDSLIRVNDSLSLQVSTLIRQSEIWDFGVQDETHLLLDAMIHIESSNNDSAYHVGEDAVGCLQIRPCMVFDVNRILSKQNKHTQYTLIDRWDRDKSKEMFHVYCNYYNLTTLEAKARSWNGGPRGASKTTTVGYWKKVRNQLES